MTWSRVKMTKDKILEPRDCPRCGRFMSREFLVERNKQRGKKISAALNGSDVGRPSTVNRPEARRLWALGWTMRRIAAQLNCSLWAVHRACRASSPRKATDE